MKPLARFLLALTLSCSASNGAPYQAAASSNARPGDVMIAEQLPDKQHDEEEEKAEGGYRRVDEHWVAATLHPAILTCQTSEAPPQTAGKPEAGMAPPR